MSAAIEENTKALNRLNNTLLTIFKISGVEVATAVVAATQSAKPEAKKPAAGATPVAPAPAPAPAATAPTPASSDAPALAYKDVADAVNAFITKFPVPEGREKALAKLASFGLKTATAATQDQWPAIIEAFKE